MARRTSSNRLYLFIAGQEDKRIYLTAGTDAHILLLGST